MFVNNDQQMCTTNQCLLTMMINNYLHWLSNDYCQMLVVKCVDCQIVVNVFTNKLHTIFVSINLMNV